MIGSLYVSMAAVVGAAAKEAEESNLNGSTRSSDSAMQEVNGRPASSSSLPSNCGGRTSTELVHTTTMATATTEASRPSLTGSHHRKRVAKMLHTVADYVGTAAHDQFDDSGFRRGRANTYPEVPGEEHRNSVLSQIREHYNNSSREPSPSPSPRRPELQDLPSSSSAGSPGGRSRTRRDTSDTLQVPSQAHVSPARSNPLASFETSAVYIPRDENSPTIVVSSDPDTSSEAGPRRASLPRPP